MAMLDKKNYLESLKNRINANEDGILEIMCNELREMIPSYNWVGVYILNKGKLVLDSYAGEKTEHEQISLGDGLCSMAIMTNAIVNEPDVKSNGKYLACFPSTSSEIVVPIRHNGKAIGEIDIDSDAKNAFGEEDEAFLSDIAELISGKVEEKFLE